MAITNKAVTNSTATSIYTSSGNSAVSTVHFYNSTGSALSANLYVVPSGFVANTTNQIYGNVSITAQNTFVIDREKFVLSAGDALFANGSVSGISATVTYIGI